MTPSEFWSFVDRRGPGECWPWIANIHHGYGRRGRVAAHRMAYEIGYGPIPTDLTVDHMCFNTVCCNPRHLRLLSMVENARRNRQSRATHCKWGHPFDEANTYLAHARSGVHRRCRACNRRAVAEGYVRRRASGAGTPANTGPTPHGSVDGAVPAPESRKLDSRRSGTRRP